MQTFTELSDAHCSPVPRYNDPNRTMRLHRNDLHLEEPCAHTHEPNGRQKAHHASTPLQVECLPLTSMGTAVSSQPL